MNTSADAINAAYNRLALAIYSYGASERGKIAADAERDRTLAIAQARGDINGSNAEKRLAQALDLYPALFATCDEADRRAAIDKTELDLARVEIERERSLLRLDEILTRKGVTNGDADAPTY